MKKDAGVLGFLKHSVGCEIENVVAINSALVRAR